MRLDRPCRRVPALLLPLAIGSPLPAVAQTVADPPSELHPSASDPPGGRFVRSLALIRAVADPEPRTSLLLDLLEDCAPSDCPAPPGQLLAEGAMGVAAVREPARKVEFLLRLARLQHRLDQPEQAVASLAAARQEAQGVKAAERAPLLLRVSLAYGALDQEEAAAALLAKAGPEQPGMPKGTTAPFPFTTALTQVNLGVGLSGASYLDTTGLASINLDLYSQAARSDLAVDLMASADYDSSRDFNNVRPHSQAVIVYRHHLNRRWNLFFDQLVSVNTDTFSSDNNDEDLSVLSASFVGAGLNLWRGEDPSSFVELQLGAGVRYEYEYINFQLQENEAYPAPVLVLRSRELPVGSGRLNQTLALGSSMLDWSNIFIWSSSRLKFPLSNNRKWWWSNELVLRYRNLPVIQSNPRVTALFSTGLTYSF